MSRSGPNTAPGKARVSKNAVTHGIISPSPVLTGLEEEAKWERRRGGEIEDPPDGGHRQMDEPLHQNIKTTKQFPDANAHY